MIKKLLLLALLILPLALNAQDELVAEKVAGNVYMIPGGGGNIGVCIGEDGTFMIDDQFADRNEAIMNAIKKAGGGEVQFLVNTHFHHDHTSGNEIMGESGSVIFAHENVRKRLSMEQVLDYTNMKKPALAKVGLPVVTFTQDITFHYNGDEIDVIHLGPAHTDGDAIVLFKNANVIHCGDIFFESIYPFIDLQNGGSVKGMIDAIDRIIDMSDPETKLISGHGAVSDYDGFIAYRAMLTTVYERVKKMIAEGKSLDEIVAAKPTAEYDEKLDNNFTPAANFIGFIYQELTAK